MAGTADVSWLLEQCAAFVADPDGHRERCRADDPGYLARMATSVRALADLHAENFYLRGALCSVTAVAESALAIRAEDRSDAVPGPGIHGAQVN